jgi:acyl-CoA dehydrogenase
VTYAAPIADILAALRHAADLDALAAEGLYPALTPDLVEPILTEAGRFAGERIAPLNRVGDTAGVALVDGRVRQPPGFADAYKDWAAAGWNALVAPTEFGGQGLPVLLNSACVEMWNGASIAWGLAPLLTMGAIEALTAHGSPALKAAYLPRLVSGEWTGTMNLTEPQAGSDLALLKSRAERAGDGTYRIFGQKIYITYGDHEMAENIIHLVLARLPDAPPGTKGISLFLVPKFLLDADGNPGARNDLHCHALESKLGIHGSPTCTMIYGDKGGAVGYLIGEENRGLACMFTMMNNARLAVALQGVGVAEHATQQAIAYAAERRQGRAAGVDGPAPIDRHPDVRRMLIEMRAKTAAARGLCYQVAAAIDRAHAAPDPATRATHAARASLLTPVAKSFATDIAVEVASLGIQVHGGMGFVEATGAAQHLRDARILPIYEGTNGIQAIDLVTRKLPLDDGAVVRGFIADLKTRNQACAQANQSLARPATRLAVAIDALASATEDLLDAVARRPADALAAATPYQRLFALAAGGVCLMAEAAGDPQAHRVERAAFFAGQLANAAPALAESIRDGAEALGEAALA